MDSIWVLALAYPAVIAALFYFAFLRPVQQQRKKQRKQLASLRVGDEVLTQAGFIATIKEVRVPEERGPTVLILDLGGVEVRAVASAIVERLTPAEDHKTTSNEPAPHQVAGRTQG
ncbi:MAG: preprotein translocase subunit YajC [Planctomycetota bacterium]|jgi:preprotein translocase subunit YajC